MIKIENWQIIGEYFDESTDSERKREIEAILNTNEKSKADFEFSKKIWTTSLEPVKIDSIDSKDKLRHIAQINQAIQKKKGAFIKIYFPKKQYYYIAAAVALLILGSAIGFFSYRSEKSSINTIVWQEQNTLLDEKILFTLDDGTLIWLDENSTLSYLKDYGKTNRKVKLEGKAFFDVTESKNHPFTISTPSTSVQVLGTSFSFSDRKEEQTVNLEVITGKVAFSDNENIRQVIEKNQSLHFNKIQKTLHVNKRNKYPGWKKADFKISFESTPLALVLNTLSKHYDVSITIAEENLKKEKITAKYSTRRSIKNILNSITIALDLKYKFEDDKYVVSK